MGNGYLLTNLTNASGYKLAVSKVRMLSSFFGLVQFDGNRAQRPGTCPQMNRQNQTASLSRVPQALNTWIPKRAEPQHTLTSKINQPKQNEQGHLLQKVRRETRTLERLMVLE